MLGRVRQVMLGRVRLEVDQVMLGRLSQRWVRQVRVRLEVGQVRQVRLCQGGQVRGGLGQVRLGRLREVGIGQIGDWGWVISWGGQGDQVGRLGQGFLWVLGILGRFGQVLRGWVLVVNFLARPACWSLRLVAILVVNMQSLVFAALNQFAVNQVIICSL